MLSSELSIEQRNFLKSEQGRKWLIEKPSKIALKDNWQEYHTPYWFCTKMISNTDINKKSILVLFNIEFLEVLIMELEVPSKNITFLADCRLESETATKIYHVDNKVVNNIEDFQEVLKKMNKQFDLCFSNPPYSSLIDLSIITKVYNIVDEMIIVHPGNWLIERKRVDGRFTNIISLFSNTLKSATFFNGNHVFGINQHPPCVITHICKSKEEETPIIVDYFGDEFLVSNINNITIHASRWESIVLPFKNKVEKYIEKSGLGSLADNIIIKENLNSKKYYIQLSGARGNVTSTKNGTTNWKTPMWKNDFFTMIQEDTNSKINKIDGNSELIYQFNTEKELHNFIEYIKTNFARFCLSILKAGSGVSKFEVSLVPWMDFTKEWNDEDLYKEFNIQKETIDYIINIDPGDYYGLRKKNETI